MGACEEWGHRMLAQNMLSQMILIEEVPAAMMALEGLQIQVGTRASTIRFRTQILVGRVPRESTATIAATTVAIEAGAVLRRARVIDKSVRLIVVRLEGAYLNRVLDLCANCH